MAEDITLLDLLYELREEEDVSSEYQEKKNDNLDGYRAYPIGYKIGTNWVEDSLTPHKNAIMMVGNMAAGELKERNDG